MSFNIIDNVSPKPAMYVRVPTPEHFKTKLDESHYWDKEFKKWNNGFSGLTGVQYFYLQECVIPNAFGKPIRPYFRDCDKEFFDTWDHCTKNGFDLMMLKRREIGLSTWGGGVLPLYNALTNAGSDSVMTSASKTRLQAMFRKKTEYIYDKLNPYYREDKARKTQSGQLFIAKEDKATKTFSGHQSSIWSIDTQKDIFGFESFRASYIFIDEGWLHPHVAEVKSSANASRMDGFTRIAPILIGGTAGLMNQKGSQEALKLYKSSKETNTMVLFLGGTKGIKEFSQNGWCDEKAAEEWILKKRDELSKSDDKTEYFKFLTSYPLSIEETFNLITDCALPPSIQATLNEAERKIDSEGIKQSKYILVNTGTSVFAQPDELKGKITIIKPPIKGHRYGMGVDPIPFGNNLLGEGSDFSAVVGDLDTMEIVADYTERNLDSKEAISNTINLQKLYYSAPAMLELNRGEVAMKEYEARGLLQMLALMPTHLGIVWSERKFPFGFHMNNHVAARCEHLAIKYLHAYAHNLRHRRAISEFRRLSTEANTDVLSAIKAFLLYAEELTEISKKQTYKPQVVRTLRGQWNNGVFKQVVVESTINR